MVVDSGHAAEQMYGEPVPRDCRILRLVERRASWGRRRTVCRVDAEHVISNIIRVWLVAQTTGKVNGIHCMREEVPSTYDHHTSYKNRVVEHELIACPKSTTPGEENGWRERPESPESMEIMLRRTFREQCGGDVPVCTQAKVKGRAYTREENAHKLRA